MDENYEMKASRPQIAIRGEMMQIAIAAVYTWNGFFSRKALISVERIFITPPPTFLVFPLEIPIVTSIQKWHKNSGPFELLKLFVEQRQR